MKHKLRSIKGKCDEKYKFEESIELDEADFRTYGSSEKEEDDPLKQE